MSKGQGKRFARGALAARVYALRELMPEASCTVLALRLSLETGHTIGREYVRKALLRRGLRPATDEHWSVTYELGLAARAVGITMSDLQQRAAEIAGGQNG